MLASLAEGRHFEDDEECMKRGDAGRCELSLGDIGLALAMYSRVGDVVSNDGVLAPITGVMAAELLPLDEVPCPNTHPPLPERPGRA